MKLHLALDSGAFSLWAKFTKGKKGKESFAFFSSQEFDDFKVQYTRWLSQHGFSFDFCATLDVIFAPDLSYQLWCVLRKSLPEEKIKLLPVVHYGEDCSWVQRYLDAGADYLGLGGMAGGTVSYTSYRPWVSQMFRYIPKDVKVHGFAVTGYDALRSHPWYSVDSTSPVLTSANGSIVLPGSGKQRLYQFSVSRTSSGEHHLANLGDVEKTTVARFLKQYDMSLDDVSGQNYMNRYLCNYLTLNKMAEKLGVRYYLSGCPGRLDNFYDLLRKNPAAPAEFNYLGSYFYLNYMTELRKIDVSQTTSTETRKPSSTQPRLRSRIKAPLLRSRPRVRFQ